VIRFGILKQDSHSSATCIWNWFYRSLEPHHDACSFDQKTALATPRPAPNESNHRWSQLISEQPVGSSWIWNNMAYRSSGDLGAGRFKDSQSSKTGLPPFAKSAMPPTYVFDVLQPPLPCVLWRRCPSYHHPSCLCDDERLPLFPLALPSFSPPVIYV